MTRLYNYIENVYAYVYNPFIDTITEYPKVDVVVETIKHKDHTTINAYLYGDGIDRPYNAYEIERSVLRSEYGYYVVWFKKSNLKEASIAIYNQLSHDLKLQIQEMETTILNIKKQIAEHEKKIAEFN